MHPYVKGETAMQRSDEQTLAEMVELARSGDSLAFDALFSSYNASICTFLARMVGNEEEGRDLAQETFLKVWRTLPSIRDTTRFRSWLYRIATNVALDYQRARYWQRFFKRGLLSRPLDSSVHQRGLEERLVEAELVQEALAQLSPTNRSCLLLKIDAGFSLQEIATMLHISAKNVSVSLCRGREQFYRAYCKLATEQEAPSERRSL
ncbi:MAG TPA: sigma-70 family RNA polymerase sigma factor [Ktedonosporobacter sp.]|nr:sigma-70 family RNA polymerase sigma factor [Ktedonosporobacter sp.]